MNKIKKLLETEKEKMNLPFNSIFFEGEEFHKKRTITIKKYETDSFLPYSCYKPILNYIEK